MNWVRDFYTRFEDYVGAEAVSDRDHDRVAIIERLAGPAPKRILELGAGDGQTAFCMANAGHDVTAVELAPSRVAALRRIAATIHSGTIDVREADFFGLDLDGKFEVVAYWDGFGAGDDADQRRLLRRIADDWLTDGGLAVLDVFNPSLWIRLAGGQQTLERCEPCHKYRELRTWDYDPVGNRWIDTWCPIDDSTGEPMEPMAITQTIRCYSPSDFLMLLQGTGLAVVRAEVGEASFDMTESADHNHPIWEAASYRVVLSRE